ncbi:hypothetical protein AVEN_1971-1 [Araneus ventricosus]|uniref:Uncharacterized protein n=1 Tax=Araneus ventricosus TaxID=182803 RepID=A0A4Y2IQG7_ARAVE|nr:hypothetical protein AVEN_1971-1 [Araneus ventricosus]
MKSKFQEECADRIYARKGREWEAVEAMANKLVSKIFNRVKLRKKIMELLWPVCYRILQWESIHGPSIGNHFLRRFYWKTKGRIDKTRTVRYIIGSKNISMRRRFVLSPSMHDIHQMWREMSNDDVMYFYGENGEKSSPPIRFWAYTVERFDDFTESYPHSVCKCEFDNWLVEAIKYRFAITAEDGGGKNWHSFILGIYLKS